MRSKPRALEEGAADTFLAGVNDAGISEYMPPAQPPGHGDHFYYFHLYASDGPTAPDPDHAGLLESIDGCHPRASAHRRTVVQRRRSATPPNSRRQARSAHGDSA